MNAFMSQLETDLQDVFLNLEEFGEEVVFHRAGTADLVIRALFDTPARLADPDTENSVVAVEPRLIVRSSDIPWPVSRADTVTVRGKVYRISRWVDEKLGHAELYLHHGGRL